MATAFRQGARNRKAPDPSNVPQTRRAITPTLSASSNKLRLTFLEEVANTGIPVIGISGGAHVGTEYPTAVNRVSALVYDLTYTNNVAAADIVHAPMGDICLRGRYGQLVQLATQAVP